MFIEIKHRYTDNVICSFDVTTVKEAVEKAVKQGANLRGANLSGANLSGANLSGANLSCVYLRGADLRGADLRGADLSGANMRGADMYGADLSGADMRGADMRGASLSCANLSGANLSCANLSGANLSGANLSGVKNSELVIAQQSIVPEGQIIVWKKLKNDVIAKLSIPGNAKRVNAIGSRKCRASMAFVHELSDGSQSGFDKYTGKLEYKVGEFVTPDSFDDSIYKECSNGIHFFLTRTEAENY